MKRLIDGIHQHEIPKAIEDDREGRSLIELSDGELSTVIAAAEELPGCVDGTQPFHFGYVVEV